ncbi:flavodoxin family protein [Turicibacter sanguinis]|nr:flavodoxin family protein [Turicibacter sanguinis]MTP48363.1 flavodoxin family protein [Turicibacter sanguinis]MTP50431.1 flavodoxin family protein [Turicibacter sanguinis]MTQ06742.1 flavodoxin family protein [Turicibacter sanguinis]
MKKSLLAALLAVGLVGCAQQTTTPEQPTADETETTTEETVEVEETEETEVETEDATTGASVVDGSTSASIVPKELVQDYKPAGFTDSDSKKALFVIGDPRKDSVHYDLARTAMKHFEENGVEVEVRDLYEMNFNPVLMPEEFYYAKDGNGEPTEVIKAEQELVTEADYIIFSYPNWHDTPTAIVKGYMEKVFAKKFAYQDTAEGLQGMLTDKSIYTIMNAGFLGGGRGYIGDGVGINDAAWDEYMKAFEVLDNDTAGFWGVENKGRFVNDRTPKNDSENYETELNELRDALKAELDEVFFN